MNERDAILARIREALRVPAPPPEIHPAPRPAPHAASAESVEGTPPRPEHDAPAHRPPGRDFGAYLPPVGQTFEEWVAAFASASRELRTDFHLLGSGAEAQERLAALRQAEGWQSVAAHRGALAGPAASALGLLVIWTDDGYDRTVLERADAGITECDALVAQTGSVVVTSASAGGRVLSVLPPHHVVLARREQMVADLPAAFRLLRDKYGANYPSMISLITGPSRTGDIERILVLGAHGPRKLTVLCW